MVEEHFLKNTTRESTEKYIVRQPFNERINNIGDPYPLALKRFYSIERKFKKDETFKRNYSTFLSKYLKLGHMSELNESNLLEEGYFYLIMLF